jgi:hypothetical protein
VIRGAYQKQTSLQKCIPIPLPSFPAFSPTRGKTSCFLLADTLHNIAGLAQNLAGNIGSNLESCRKQTGNTKERTSLWPRDSFIAATVHNDYRCGRTRGSIMLSRERAMSYVTMLCSEDIHIICKTRKFQSRGKIGRQA